MSPIDPAEILWYNGHYIAKICAWHDLACVVDQKLHRFPDFPNHNYLLRINRFFSSDPHGIIHDRSGLVRAPLKIRARAWKTPVESSLEQSLERMVDQHTNQPAKINLFWSGGLDSTTMVNAFLKYSSQHDQLRVLYSPWTTYEHPDYLDFLRSTKLELIDISGDVYAETQFDGIFLTGDGSDELTASIDQSFVEHHGLDFLRSEWRPWFADQNPDEDFLSFCEDFFGQSDRRLDTVLEARWWFYAICKNTYQLRRKLNFFSHYGNFDSDRLIGFFDCEHFESFAYHAIDHLIDTDYKSWKRPLKEFCWRFDGFRDWCDNYSKRNSNQLLFYTQKQQIMKDHRTLFMLSDNQRVWTPSLPFLLENEYRERYGQRFSYLFNSPKKS